MAGDIITISGQVFEGHRTYLSTQDSGGADLVKWMSEQVNRAANADRAADRKKG
jgi:hypothetical protein